MFVALKSVLDAILVFALTAFGGITAIGLGIAPEGGYRAVFSLIGALAIVSPAIVVWRLSRHGRWNWRARAFGWSGVVLAAAIFIADGPAPSAFPTVSEVGDAEQSSYALLMEHGSRGDSDASQAFAAKKGTSLAVKGGLQDREAWSKVVRARRDAIEHDWALFNAERAWITKLSEHSQIGDQTPAVLDAEIMRFDVWRIVTTNAAAMASLRALDGHGDDAVNILLPFLKAGAALEPQSKSLVRSMIARVVTRTSLEAIDFVMDHAPVGERTRQDLAAALQWENPKIAARRMIESDIPMMRAFFLAPESAFGRTNSAGPQENALRRLFRLGGPLVYNPHSTIGMFESHVAWVANAAAERRLQDIEAEGERFYRMLRNGAPKNVAGRMLLLQSMPSYRGVVKNFWAVEDLRAHVEARVARPPLQ